MIVIMSCPLGQDLSCRDELRRLKWCNSVLQSLATKNHEGPQSLCVRLCVLVFRGRRSATTLPRYNPLPGRLTVLICLLVVSLCFPTALKGHAQSVY